MPVNTVVQIRRGTSTNWSSTNPTLNAGEWGFETDTKRYKIGDGTTAWNSLNYAAISPSDFIGGTGINLSLGVNNATLTINNTAELNANNVTGLTEFIQDTVGTGLIGVSGVSTVYDDNTGLTTIFLSDPVVDASDVNNLQETVEDIIGGGNFINTGFLRNNTGIAWTYSDNSNTLSASVTGITLSLITDVTANTTEVNYLDGSTPGTISASNVVVVDANKNITGFNNITSTGTVAAYKLEVENNLNVGGAISTTGNIHVGGNLTVQGTTTTVNSNNVEIGDNIIRVNTSGLSTGGFEVFDGVGYQSLIWNNTNSSWEITGPKVISTGTIEAKVFESKQASPVAPFIVASTGLVSNLNADLLDGENGSYYLDWNNTTNKPDPVITVNLTGDVSGSGNITLTDLSSGTVSINTVVQPNSIALGTDTTGDYVSSVSVNGTGLSITGTGESSSVAITSNATSANSTGTLVARDSNGSFSANIINANSFVGYGGGLTGINADTVSSGTFNINRLPLNIPITNLASSGITLGANFSALGSSVSVISSLSSISGASINNPTILSLCLIDGGSP